MPEPDWKTALRADLADAADDIERGNRVQGGVDYARRSLEETVFEAVEAAYKRGLTAGRSQAGYRKSARGSECPTCLSATDADESTASAGDP